MPRPKPRSTLEDLMLFTVIGFFFAKHTLGGMHPPVILMFVILFFVLAVLKAVKDKKESKPPGKTYAIAAFSFLAISVLAYITNLVYLQGDN